MNIPNELRRIAHLLKADWPSTISRGGLREALGLDPKKPLEDQTNPSTVIRFFKQGDESERGMVLFAVNSNQDNSFWKKVYDGIEEDE